MFPWDRHDYLHFIEKRQLINVGSACPTSTPTPAGVSILTSLESCFLPGNGLAGGILHQDAPFSHLFMAVKHHNQGNLEKTGFIGGLLTLSEGESITTMIASMVVLRQAWFRSSS